MTYTDPSFHTARKEHQCTWCGETIKAEEWYSKRRHYGNDGAHTIKFHTECEKAFNGFDDNGGIDEWQEGDMTRGCTCSRGSDCPHDAPTKSAVPPAPPSVQRGDNDGE